MDRPSEVLKSPKTAGIPVIFLSARAQQADLRKGYEAGVAEYITKPFEPVELLSIVENVLAGTYVRLRIPPGLLMIAEHLHGLLMQGSTGCAGTGSFPRRPSRPSSFQRPARPEHGEYSSNLSLALAKSAKIPPRKLAEQLVDRSRQSDAGR